MPEYDVTRLCGVLCCEAVTFVARWHLGVGHGVVRSGGANGVERKSIQLVHVVRYVAWCLVECVSAGLVGNTACAGV